MALPKSADFCSVHSAVRDRVHGVKPNGIPKSADFCSVHSAVRDRVHGVKLNGIPKSAFKFLSKNAHRTA
jgi:hypothetical protein